MAASQTSLSKTLFWGGLTAVLYWVLFHYADEFLRLAHTTVDACVVQAGMKIDYFNKATQALCAKKGGTLVAGTWWYVFAPIGLALALSYTHGIFTGLFWDVVGLKARK